MHDLSIVWYPTLRCNLKCAYCASRSMPVATCGRELSAEAWQDIFLSYPKRIERVSVTGGEPTLFQGLADVLLATKAPVCIDTNLRVPVENWFLSALAGQIEALNCGLQFHPEHPEAAVYWERLAQLRDLLPDAQLACCQVVLWRDPEEARLIAQARAEAIGVEYRPLTFDDSFLYRDRVPAKPGRYAWCEAGLNFAVALPDGTLFRCLGHAYFNYRPMGNLQTDGWALLHDVPQPCDKLLCTSCDFPGQDPVRYERG